MTPRQTPDIQLFYAKLLDGSAKAGFVFIFVAFVVYVLGLLPSHTPLEELSAYWSQPLSHYLAHTRPPLGWNWVWDLHHADHLTILAIATLAGVTILGYVALTVKFLKNRTPILAAIALVQLLILLLAASGLLKAGGH